MKGGIWQRFRRPNHHAPTDPGGAEPTPEPGDVWTNAKGVGWFVIHDEYAGVWLCDIRGVKHLFVNVERACGRLRLAYRPSRTEPGQ